MFDSETCLSKSTGQPLKSYENELEAEDAIGYVKAAYGNEQVKYLCQKCGYWHLSPKNRQTPNHKSYCLDSNGRPKQAYPTRESALRRAEIIYEERGTQLYVYHCADCDEWHLTHNPESF
jgi:hypothetical protein